MSHKWQSVLIVLLLLLSLGCFNERQSNVLTARKPKKLSIDPPVVVGHLLSSELAGSDISSLLDTSFALINRRDSVLVVELFSTSCGCLGLLRGTDSFNVGDTIELAPGEIVPLKFVVKTTDETLAVRERAIFKLSDGEMISARISVSIYPDLVVDSHRVVCEFEATGAEANECDVRVVQHVRARDSKTARSISLIPTIGTADLISQRQMPGTSIWQRDWIVKARIPRPIDGDVHPLEMELRTDAESRPTPHKITFLRRVARKIRHPDLIVFNYDGKSQVGSRRIRLQSAGGEAFRILRIDVGELPLEVEFTDRRSSSHWLRVTPTGGMVEQYDGHVTIVTDFPEAEDVSFAVKSVNLSRDKDI